MKYGIYYAYWEHQWEADYRKYVEKAAKLDFDILEIGAAPLGDYTEQDVRELRKCADDFGMILTAGYGPSYNHNIGSVTYRAEALEWYKKVFYAMAGLDIHKLGGAIYSYWPVDFSTCDKASDWKNSVEGIRILAEEAKKYDITLEMEVLNRFENHILNTASEGVRFIKEVDQENVKLMLDTFHMNIEENSMGGAIREAKGLLGHFHVGECNRMVPGKGRMPWREISDALKDIDYHGTVVMEPFVRMGGQVGSDIKIWREMCPGATEEELDLDAKQSVHFLRYMFE